MSCIDLEIKYYVGEIEAPNNVVNRKPQSNKKPGIIIIGSPLLDRCAITSKEIFFYLTWMKEISIQLHYSYTFFFLIKTPTYNNLL